MKIIIVAPIAMLLSFAPAVTLAQAVPVPTPTPAQASGETAVVTVPAGWTATPPTVAIKGFTMTNMWAPPASLSEGENIGLGYVDGAGGVPMDTVVTAMSATFQKLFGAENPVVSHAEKVCNGTADGWYFENNVTFGAMNLVSEAMITIGKSRLFEVTYTRTNSEKEDAGARKALDSLCVKG